MRTTRIMLRGAIVLFLFLSFHFSFASYAGGSIMGQVVDPVSKEPVSDATVVLDCQGNQKMFLTNEQGFYYASNIPAGVYIISVSFMSNRTIIENFKIGNDEVKEANAELNTSISIGEVVKKEYRVSLLDPLQPQGVRTLEREDIKNMPIQNIAQLQEIMPGTIEDKGQFYVRGARAGALAYYIDGARVMGSADIPLCGLDTYKSYTGFLPPKYGDCTGGAVVMETRNFFTEH
ncbi:MAG: carboxypeptidase-like regulatory domain-containing protein [Bacteroidetes bacterium]|nr:carboxypeptidase-like regulatory domain-containing protein [Bacteroidota bacterium]